MVILSVFHLLENLHIGAVIMAVSSAVILSSLYFFVRYRTCLLIPKIIITIPTLVLLDITWYVKYLSNGPLLMFILVFGALIIWVWKGRALIFMLIYYFLNIIVLFVIEYYAHESLYTYPDHHTRIIDIYLSLFFYAVLLIFLLSRVKKEFTEEKEKAVRSDKLKSAFLANMSHEIRTPLNSIVGFSQLIHTETDMEKKKAYSEIINKSSDNLLSLINDIIDLSKIEVGDTKMKYSCFSIEETFSLMKDVFTNVLTSKNKSHVTIDYDLPDGDFIVYSEPVRLKQIISNLLSNAIKFTQSGGISFCCKQVGNELLFEVSDTGIGIREEDQKEIFNHFTKLDGHGENEEGTGIGLSIVTKLISLLDGKIWVKSNVGTGTTFFFTLPYIKSELDPETTKEVKVKRSKSHIKKNILVVEDDKSSRMLLKEILRPIKADISYIDDGKKAIDFVQTNPEIGIILMDIQLPTIDGYTASNTIKKINPNIFIIAQTANAMVGDKDKALKAGCDYYITKPINPVELLGILDALT